jgi:hypothetical protein
MAAYYECSIKIMRTRTGCCLLAAARSEGTTVDGRTGGGGARAMRAARGQQTDRVAGRPTYERACRAPGISTKRLELPLVALCSDFILPSTNAASRSSLAVSAAALWSTVRLLTSAVLDLLHLLLWRR